MTYLNGYLYHVLICEDDMESLQANKELVEKLSYELDSQIEIHTYRTLSEELFRYIDMIDIAILDIDIEGESGLQFARKILNHKPEIPIIFITRYVQYRNEASLLMAFGLLGKPVDREKFGILFRRAFAQVMMDSKLESKNLLEFIISKKVIKIKMNSIISMEKVQKKVLIKTDHGIYEVRDTITAMEQRLTPCFLRISQSVILNMNEIICIEGNDVFVSTRDVFRIGKTYQQHVEKTYRKYWK